MEYTNSMLQTYCNAKSRTQIGRAKSCDASFFAEQLTPAEVKILLHTSNALVQSNTAFETIIHKQQLLAHKKLFDPFKYFGSSTFATVDQAFRFHHPRLEAMFSPYEQITERKTPKRIRLKGSVGHRQDDSPLLPPKSKGCQSRAQPTKRGVGRSPKSCVRQNKQNYQRLNLNNMQKMRVKLKIGKKATDK